MDPVAAPPLSAEDTVRLDATRPVAELLAGLPAGWTLPVEPLSARTTLAAFLRAGGMGWGSARAGGLGASVCRIVTDRFACGTDRMTLYNVGYPLHRFLEWGPGPQGVALLAGVELGAVRELIVRLVPTEPLRAAISPEPLEKLRLPHGAREAFYVNAAGARLFGLEQPGSVIFSPARLDPLALVAPASGWREVPAAPLWEQRFLADRLPEGVRLAQFLARKSHLARLAELAPAGRVCFALATHLGFLVALSGDAGELARAREAALALAGCRELEPGAGAGQGPGGSAA